MSFYQQLNKYYDLVFPYKQVQADFLDKQFRKRDCIRLLDVACGTGTYSLELARRGFNLLGVDLSESMIASAGAKAEAEGIRNLDFQVMDMIALDANAIGKWDGCFCIGNSLVHLQSDEEICAALKAMISGMQKGQGVFITQIVNFDAVLKGGGVLPLLEGEADGIKVGFKRWYEPLSEASEQVGVNFCTRLTVHGLENGTWENKIPLRSLKQAELAALLKSAGIDQVEWYGDFKGTPWQESSSAIIAVGYI